MRGVITWLICAFVALSGAFATAAALPTTYSITGPNPLLAPTPFVPPCAVGDCRNLTTTGVVGSFTVPAPLAPSAVTFLLGYATDMSISAGGLTISSADPNFRIYFAAVLTDASGVVIAYIFQVQRLARNTIGTGDTGAADPNARLDEIDLQSGNNRYVANVYCVTRDTDGACLFWLADDSSSSTADAGSSVVAFSISVPTLSEWAMIALGLVLAGVAAWRIRRVAFTAPTPLR
jgi:hypothetical protein